MSLLHPLCSFDEAWVSADDCLELYEFLFSYASFINSSLKLPSLLLLCASLAEWLLLFIVSGLISSVAAFECLIPFWLFASPAVREVIKHAVLLCYADSEPLTTIKQNISISNLYRSQLYYNFVSLPCNCPSPNTVMPSETLNDDDQSVYFVYISSKRWQE